MLTDDDLTRELGTAFRTATDELTYRGRRRPRRTAVVAVPLAAVGIAVAAIAINLSLNDAPAPPIAAEQPTHEPSSSPSPALVTERVSLAGYTFSYQHQAGKPAPIYAELVTGGLPDGVTPVPDTGSDAKAWTGKDPKSGDNALYVQAPTRSGGALFVLISSELSQQQLIDVLKTGAPRAVPLVKR